MKNKILFISSEFPPLPGGIGNHAFLLSKNLQKNNYLVKVITNHRENKFNIENKFDSNQAFEIIRVKRYKIILFTYLLRILNVFFHSKNRQIIIASGKFSLWCVALIKLVKSNKKCIAIIHGSEVNAGSKLSKKLTFWSLKKMDNIIAVSQFTKNIALKENKNLNINVIHNGFELNNFEHNKIELLGKPAIITVGNLTKRKGQHNFIKAIPKIRDVFPQLHYHLVGLPTERENLENLAKELKVVEHITFHGAVSEEKKIGLLKNSQIFLMLSNSIENGEVEGFGIAILEANSLGIPAIGSINSGISEAIKSNYNGILVDPNNIEEIERALINIINNYKTFSLNSKEWANFFNWDVIIEEYKIILES